MTQPSPCPDPPRSQAALARALGYSKQRVSQLTKRPWFPARGSDGWDLEAVRAALEANLDQARVEARAERREAAPPSLPAPQAPPNQGQIEVAEELEALLAELKADVQEEDSGTVAAARRVLALATRSLAEDLRAGTARAGSWTPVCKALSELRQAERASFELGKERGLYVDLHVHLLAISALGRRAVRMLDNAGTMLGTQVQIWLSDRGFRDLDGEGQQRAARQWFEGMAHDLRVAEVSAMKSDHASGVNAEIAEFEAWRKARRGDTHESKPA